MQFFVRIFTVFTFVAGVILSAQNANASDLRLLLGADFSLSSVKYSHSSKNAVAYPEEDFKTYAPVIGISAYGIGLEAYILNSNTIKEDSLEAKLRSYGIDFTGEAGLSDNFSVVASLGLAKYEFTTKGDNFKREDDCSGPRVGIGLQYYITSRLAIRGMYHYTLLNSGKTDNYDAVSEFTAGFRFIF